MASDVERDVSELSGRVAASLGLEVYDVVFHRSGSRWKLQVFVDRAGGVTLADCEAFSRQISRELDVLDPIPHAYELEVSSPGMERALRLPAHWQRAVGQKVQVRRRDETGAVRSIVATVADAGPEAVTLKDGAGIEHSVPFASILSARIHVDWT
ncbi:MAG: ribosome maturation factor RimP [Acidobacteria bacterium]|nr:ribosome maturation factor RimP [Acidobacteriota bacterium]